MPLGKLRDLPERIAAADIIIVSKCPSYLDAWEKGKWADALGLDAYDVSDCKGMRRNGKAQHLFFTTIGYDTCQPVFPEGDPRYLYTQRLILFSGIANDRPLKMYLSGTYKIVRHLDFPDHHKFSRADFSSIAGAANAYPTSVVMTTEKDCQRVRDCSFVPANLRQRLFYAPIKVNFFSDQEQETFASTLNAYLK